MADDLLRRMFDALLANADPGALRAAIAVLLDAKPTPLAAPPPATPRRSRSPRRGRQKRVRGPDRRRSHANGESDSLAEDDVLSVAERERLSFLVGAGATGGVGRRAVASALAGEPLGPRIAVRLRAILAGDDAAGVSQVFAG